MSVKTVLLTEIIAPYRIPVFNILAQELKGQFMVLFLGRTEKRREWRVYTEEMDFHHEVLPGILFQRKYSMPYFFNPTLFFKLKKYSPEVIIIGGYHQPSYLFALLYAKLFKRKLIVWCESNKHYRGHENYLKGLYKKFFLKSCTGFLVPGKSSFEYLLSFGIAEGKICIAPNAVDNDLFMKGVEKEKSKLGEFKKSKRFPKKIILFVGRLVDTKGVLDLLESYRLISKDNPDIGLVLVGNGPEEEKYRNFCREKRLDSVFFEGFAHLDSLISYYAASDIFVLPAHYDAWGLVLNEAMACGLPVVSSDTVGAAEDLITQGVNGYIFKSGNISEMVRYMDTLLKNEPERIGMGKVSQDKIHNYSPRACAQGIMQAIKGEEKK